MKYIRNIFRMFYFVLFYSSSLLSKAIHMVNTPPKVSFFTNHTYVLTLLLRLNGAPLRIIAQELGLTERAVQGLVSDLERLQVITRKKIGRTNSYTINRNVRLTGILEQHRTVHDILQFLERTELDGDAKPNTHQPQHNMPKSLQQKLRITLR